MKVYSCGILAFFILWLSSCSGAGFQASEQVKMPGSGPSNKLQEGDDGWESDGKASSGSGNEDGFDGPDDDDDDDISSTEDEISCRFFNDDDPDYAEKPAGGPDLEISPQNLDGNHEGDNYVFSPRDICPVESKYMNRSPPRLFQVLW